MIKRSIIGGGLLMILGLLAACGGNDVAPTATVPPSTPFAALTSTPNIPNSTAPLITYELTGGIAGVQEKLVIAENGDLTVIERGTQIGTGHLDANALQALKQQFDSVNFFNLKDEYNQGAVADDRFMTVTYQQNNRTKAVKVAEIGGQKITPPELSNLLSTLQQIALQAQATVTSGTPSPTPEESTDRMPNDLLPGAKPSPTP
jgi:hypothetical protein